MEKRLIELESRLAFQDDLIETLNEAVIRQQQQIERLEVIKGPNGLIFGRGGSGGIFNRVRKEANWNPVQEIRFSGGSYNHKRVSVDAGHVINDMIAVRLNGLYEHSESFRQGFELQRWGVAPTVTIKPTNRTKVVIQTELFKDDRIAEQDFTESSFNCVVCSNENLR